MSVARRLVSFPAEAVRTAEQVLNELTLPGADAIRADGRRFHQLVADGEELGAVRGAGLHTPDTPHALIATEPTSHCLPSSRGTAAGRTGG